MRRRQWWWHIGIQEQQQQERHLVLCNSAAPVFGAHLSGWRWRATPPTTMISTLYSSRSVCFELRSKKSSRTWTLPSDLNKVLVIAAHTYCLFINILLSVLLLSLRNKGRRCFDKKKKIVIFFPPDNAIQNIILGAPWFKSSLRLCAYISCSALREVDTSKLLSEILKDPATGMSLLIFMWWVLWY